MNKDLKELFLTATACVVLVGALIVGLAAELLFYGAIFVAIGAGAYWVFRWLTGGGL